jgi:hypothetical protein
MLFCRNNIEIKSLAIIMPKKDTSVEVEEEEEEVEEPKSIEEPKPVKQKKTLTPLQLEKLKVARAAARKSQIVNTEKRKEVRRLAKENKELQEKEHVDNLKQTNANLRKEKGLDKIAEEPPPLPPPPEAKEEPLPPKPKKKPTKKPIVIVQDSESESDDDNQVVYIKSRNRRKGREIPQLPQAAPPPPPKPQYQFHNPFFNPNLGRFNNF